MFQSVTLRDEENGGKRKSLSKNRDSSKYTSYNSSARNSNNPLKSDNRAIGMNYGNEGKDTGSEKDVRNIQIQKNGALNQCITELASSFKSDHRPSLASLSSVVESKGSNEEQDINDENNGDIERSSHFVTVIEVKENKVSMPKPEVNTGKLNEEKNAQMLKELSSLVASTTEPALSQLEHEQEVVSFSSFERKAKVEPSAPPMSPAMTSSTSAAISPSSFMSNVDAKRKMPPR